MTKLYISEFSKIASDANGNCFTSGSAMKIAAITTT